jgi:hypothetical protein
MSHCVKEFPPLDLGLQMAISKRVLEDRSPFTPSLMYDAKEKSKIFDLERRSSFFRLFAGQELFSLCDSLVALISARDPSFAYALRHNDVTHIHYKKGDFFEPHSDHLSLTSNHVQEFTLIMCLCPLDSSADPSSTTCEGGETRFTLNPFCQLVSKASITPYHMVLFRKDITHEGLPLQSGTKDIITLNLWGLPKAGEGPTKTLVISFPVAFGETETYTFPWSLVEKFPSCFFIQWAAFEAKKFEVLPTILDYSCTVATYEEMEIVRDILNGSHIELGRYLGQVDLVKFFGFDVSDLLLEAPETMVAKPLPTKRNMVLKAEGRRPITLIFADNVEALDLLNQQIYEERLNALTFSLGFMEGNTATAKESPPALMALEGNHMRLMCAEFGEARQILCHHISHNTCVEPSGIDASGFDASGSGIVSLTDLLNSSNIKGGFTSEQLKRLSFIWEGEEEHDASGVVMKVDTLVRWDGTTKRKIGVRKADCLYVCYEADETEGFDYNFICGPDLGLESKTMASATSALFYEDRFYYDPPYTDYVVYTGGDDSSDTSDEENDESLPYRISKRGIAFMDPPRQKALLEILETYQMIPKVMEALPTLGLSFPQERVNESAGLCNETLYINFSLVYVYGIMLFE